MSGLHCVKHVLCSTFLLSSVYRGVRRPKCVALLPVVVVPRLIMLELMRTASWRGPLFCMWGTYIRRCVFLNPYPANVENRVS